jgi:carotenoid cleavage dioxygenase-like enzyme
MQGAAFAFFHDMAITEHYYVLFQNPTTLDFMKLLTQYTLAKVRPSAAATGSPIASAA